MCFNLSLSNTMEGNALRKTAMAMGFLTRKKTCRFKHQTFILHSKSCGQRRRRRPDILDDANCNQSGWTSGPTTDHDRDGCRDGVGPEQGRHDDDNDGVNDADDDCSKSPLVYNGGNFSANDYDGDGCLDFIEDKDSDDDGTCDGNASFTEVHPTACTRA